MTRAGAALVRTITSINSIFLSSFFLGLHHYNVAFVPISIGIVFGVILVGCLMWYFSHRKKEYPPLPYGRNLNARFA